MPSEAPPDATTQRLQEARAAYQSHDWQRAVDAYAASATDDPRKADDLWRHSDAAWWLGLTDDSVRLADQAFHEFVTESRPADAARTALELSITHFLRGDEPQGMGWLGRARHLAEALDECAVHGYLLYLTGVLMGGESDAESVASAASRVEALGRRFRDANLVACGLNGRGRALIWQGRVSEGMTLLDEAMVSVLEGRLAPDYAGNLYCNTMDACHQVADLKRMARWTELASVWLDSLPEAVLFSGICRVHRSQLQAFKGDWDLAEAQARQVASDLDSVSVVNTAEAWYVVAECRRLRGDHAGAEAAYGEAHARGRQPQPGLALLRLQSGDTATAARMIDSALPATVDRLARAPISAAAVEIALANGNVEAARARALELAGAAERYGTSGLEALAATARGAVAVVAGPAEEALRVLRDACRRWYELGGEYDAARVCLQLARAYLAVDDPSSARLELARAETVFARLGAAPALTELLELRGGRSTSGGLTSREVEVLCLVAAGLSNRAIAEQLFISDRTVARHLGNIFRKLGVESRTQATRYAFDHGLVHAVAE